MMDAKVAIALALTFGNDPAPPIGAATPSVQARTVQVVAQDAALQPPMSLATLQSFVSSNSACANGQCSTVSTRGFFRRR